VAEYAAGLRVIDISNPANPVSAASFDLPDDSRAVVTAGNHAYVANDSEGLRVIDITDPTSPALVGTCDPPGAAWGVAVDGDHAYVAGRFQGLHAIDIGDPTNPILVGSCDTPGIAEDVAIAGDHAFVADGGPGLQVIDITDPTDPSIVGSHDTAGNAHGLALAGDVAYVASGNGIEIVDIRNPTSLSYEGYFDVPGTPVDIIVWGDYALVAGYQTGVHVLDISDPTDLVLVDSFDGMGGGYAVDVAMAGDHLYVAHTSSGIHVIDVFQRDVNTTANVVQSLDITQRDGEIFRARLSAVQTDSIAWELCVRADTMWVSVTPGGEWHEFDAPGPTLRWRSTHVYTGSGVNPTCSSLSIEWETATGIDEPELPSAYALHQCAPNPLAGNTRIRYEVPAPGGHVSLELFDVTGRLVRSLVDAPKAPGSHVAEWDGRNRAGVQVGAGVYFYVLGAPGFSARHSMTRLK